MDVYNQRLNGSIAKAAALLLSLGLAIGLGIDGSQLTIQAVLCTHGGCLDW